MAAADYYLCDVCGAKTFYDANLNYEWCGPEANFNPETNHMWPCGDVGFMVVLCKDCAKSHRVVIQQEPPR